MFRVNEKKERERRINVKPPRPGLCEQDVKRKSKIKRKECKSQIESSFGVATPLLCAVVPLYFWNDDSLTHGGKDAVWALGGSRVWVCFGGGSFIFIF